MPPTASNLLFLIGFISLLPLQVSAFGAGDIPSFSYLENKAFRHGDIEEILTEVAKTAGGLATGGGILQMAQSVMAAAGGSGSKFSKGDVKKVYFGNWLRDYSQAMDIGGLTKLSSDTLVLIVAVLGFMSFGFATEEFEVTPERLGVYLPVEHIDNPKGYAEKEGDARRFHPKLRPPVNPQELEIDSRTGMKNYMATENCGWDTSTAHIRRILRGCIDHGRRAGGKEGAELWEAYRLLGTALHTLEDLLAHSNWCEIALRKMGHGQVFCHVGDRVIINTPNGQAPPLVTGTFGGADFLHSLMGEATDKLSQASVTDLSKKMDDASNTDQGSIISTIKNLMSKIPHGGDSSQLSQGEALQAESKAYHFDPNNVAPPEVLKRLWALLKWRDGVFRSVSGTIESIPGLDSLLDNLSESLNAYVFTTLAPWLSPILKQATSTLGGASKDVIDSADQYEVFNNPHASDPSHSLLSKDHFALILNEPAGKIAQIVVQYSVKLVVQAWFDNRVNPDQVISQVLEAFHHPYFNVGRSKVQDEMFRALERWVNELDNRERVIGALSKEGVRSGKNKREDSSKETPGAHQHGYSEPPSSGRSYPSSQREEYRRPAPGYQQDSGGVETSYKGSSYSQGQTGYGRDERQTRPGHAGAAYVGGIQTSQDSHSRTERRGYDDPRQPSYGRNDSHERVPERSEYGGGYGASHGHAETDQRRQPHEQQRYGAQQASQDSYNRVEGTGYDDPRQASYGRNNPYERPPQNEGGYRPSYGQVESDERHAQQQSYGRERGHEVDDPHSQRQEQYERHGHAEHSERPPYQAEQPHRSHQVQEHQAGYGYSRPGDEHRRSEESRGYDSNRGSYRGGHEHGESNIYGERQESYGRSEYERPGGGYEGTSQRQRHDGSEGAGHGGRSGAHGRNEDSDGTFGVERLNLQGHDEDDPGRRGHHSHEQRYAHRGAEY